MHYPLHGGMEIMHKCLIKSSTATFSLSNVGLANSMSSFIYSHGKKITNRRHCLRAAESFNCSVHFLNPPNAAVTLMHKILLLSHLLQKSIYFFCMFTITCSLALSTGGRLVWRYKQPVLAYQYLEIATTLLIAKSKLGRCVSHFNQDRSLEHYSSLEICWWSPQ